MASNRSPETNARYAEILKPIKDLAKSWDVDIASNLDDYLDELEHTTISYDGGKTTMNFAQAAMLIHSSTCVYSKKVECLYNLQLHVLELLANRKKLNQKSSVDKDGNDADVQDLHDDDDDDFLSLDDIEEGKNLHMKENFDSDQPFQFLPEVPLCLLPLENASKGDNPLLSQKGEVLASINDFRMNTCYRHTSGTLLIDKSFIKLFEDSVGRQTEVEVQQEDNSPDGITETEQNMDIDVNQDIGDEMHVDHAGDNDDVDNDDIGVLNDISNVDNPDIPPETDEEMRLGLRRSERQKEKVVVAKNRIDPWEKLKPDEGTSTGKKPFRAGTVYKLCPGIEDKTKKRKRTKQPDVKIELLYKCIQKTLYSHKQKFPKNQLKVPTFPEFEKFFWEEFKRRQTLKRAIIKKGREELLIEENDDGDDDEEVDAPLLQLDAADDDDDDIGDLVDDNLFQAIDNALGRNESFMNHHSSPSDQGEENSFGYEQMVQKYVDEYMESAKKYAHVTEQSRRVSEWEDKVLPRLDEEETRPPFDINDYSTTIINDLDTNQTIKFQQLVQGKPIFEICRTFLASLMLANTTNVKIKERSDLVDSMDQFELELLSTRRHFEELQEYVAPSLAE
ncbi:Condensin-2 complex subunit H2 [Mactra antiquata]